MKFKRNTITFEQQWPFLCNNLKNFNFNQYLLNSY